jgi:hypothetical protein
MSFHDEIKRKSIAEQKYFDLKSGFILKEKS